MPRVFSHASWEKRDPMEGSRARFGRSVSLRPVLTAGDPRRGVAALDSGSAWLFEGRRPAGGLGSARGGPPALLALVALAAALLALLAQVGGEVLGQASSAICSSSPRTSRSHSRPGVRPARRAQLVERAARPRDALLSGVAGSLRSPCAGSATASRGGAVESTSVTRSSARTLASAFRTATSAPRGGLGTGVWPGGPSRPPG